MCWFKNLLLILMYICLSNDTKVRLCFSKDTRFIFVSQMKHVCLQKIFMETTLNTELLAGMLKDKRAGKGLRKVAEEIGGVSAPTLSRIEQGKLPDVDTFIKICNWLETPTDTFIKEYREFSSSKKDIVVAHLRAERELPTDTINMLIKMIDLAYHTK